MKKLNIDQEALDVAIHLEAVMQTKVAPSLSVAQQELSREEVVIRQQFLEEIYELRKPPKLKQDA